jgi:hypothetical protein
MLPEFARIAKISVIELQEQMTLQLVVTSSHSKINYGTWAPIEFGSISTKVYLDIANIDGYNIILGTPFPWEHWVSELSIFHQSSIMHIGNLLISSSLRHIHCSIPGFH